jgi:hypothetical protein
MKSKPILKVLTLFLLGMALGAMIMGWYVQRELNRMHHHKGGEGFARHITKMSGTEGEKREQVYNLSLSYGEKMNVLEKSFRQDRIIVMDSLSKEVEEILDGKEKEEFLLRMERMKKGPPHEKKDKPH